MAEPVEKTPPAGATIEIVRLLDVKREPDDDGYANSLDVKRELVEVEVSLLEVKCEPDDVDADPLCVKREPIDFEDVNDRDVLSTAGEQIDFEVPVTQPANIQYMLTQRQLNLVEDRPAGRFTTNSALLDSVKVESGNINTKLAVRQKKDGATLKKEFRKRQSAEERHKRKAAYMREYRARRKRRRLGVPYDDAMEERELAETGDLEQLNDTNDKVRASTSAESEPVSIETEKILRDRARRAEKKRNYRARKKAMKNKTASLHAAQNETITVPVEWDNEHQEQLTQNSVGFQQMESHLLSNVTIKQENTDDTGTCGAQYCCNVCRKRFKLESAYQRHLLTHTAEDKYDICNTNLPQKLNFNENISDHTSQTSHDTTKLLKKITLKSHILTHSGEESHRCDVCNKNFSKKRSLKKHMVTHTERQHRCDLCNKNFSEKGSLKKHMLTHTGEKPHRCDVCNKNFSEKGNLKTHMLTHTGERPHDCSICSKSFTRSGHLKRHMLSHTGVKPYCCIVCNKYFSVESTLRHHMLIHTGERPHLCDLCNKNFSRPEHLKSHMLTHTGERPYCCDVCNRSFSEKYNLRHHILTHTGEKPHRCFICNKGFSRLGRLKSHLLSHK